MPTPSPIIAASSGEKVGITSRWVSSSSTAMPIASPSSATRIGRPIATTEPKAISMMKMAAVTPIPSAGPGEAATTVEIGAPPSATLSPGSADACAVSITRWTAAAGSRPTWS